VSNNNLPTNTGRLIPGEYVRGVSGKNPVLAFFCKAAILVLVSAVAFVGGVLADRNCSVVRDTFSGCCVQPKCCCDECACDHCRCCK